MVITCRGRTGGVGRRTQATSGGPSAACADPFVCWAMHTRKVHGLQGLGSMASCAWRSIVLGQSLASREGKEHSLLPFTFSNS